MIPNKTREWLYEKLAENVVVTVATSLNRMGTIITVRCTSINTQNDDLLKSTHLLFMAVNLVSRIRFFPHN